MKLFTVLSIVLLGVIILGFGLFALGKRLQRREPYASFGRLPWRRKVRFFRMVVADRRAPLLVRALPLLLVGYLALPIDLIPDFIPVLGYVDDVAIVLATLALVVRLTPRAVVDDLLEQLGNPDIS